MKTITLRCPICDVGIYIHTDIQDNEADMLFSDCKIRSICDNGHTGDDLEAKLEVQDA